jgi:hypothetical protein
MAAGSAECCIPFQILSGAARATMCALLQILEDAVKTKWNILPEEQRKGIRQVLSDLIISVATSGDSAKNRVYLHKLNVVLVQVRLHFQPSGHRSRVGGDFQLNSRMMVR